MESAGRVLAPPWPLPLLFPPGAGVPGSCLHPQAGPGQPCSSPALPALVLTRGWGLVAGLAGHSSVVLGLEELHQVLPGDQLQHAQGQLGLGHWGVMLQHQVCSLEARSNGQVPVRDRPGLDQVPQVELEVLELVVVQLLQELQQLLGHCHRLPLGTRHTAGLTGTLGTPGLCVPGARCPHFPPCCCSLLPIPTLDPCPPSPPRIPSTEPGAWRCTDAPQHESPTEAWAGLALEQRVQ